MTASFPGARADEQAFLDSVEGEISFFRSIMRARPIGKHRHFHILMVRNAILRDTGRSLHIESLWEKMKKCYNLDALEAVDIEAENYHTSKAHAGGVTTYPVSSTTDSVTSLHHTPSPSENLSGYPFFDKEFSLPYDEFEGLIAQRRIRETASLPSSPASTSPGPAAATAAAAAEGKSSVSRRSSVAAAAGTTLYAGTVPVVAGRSSTRRASGSGSAANASTTTTTTRASKRKLTKSKLNLAGLVGGDSDSSALTLESGDEAGEGEGEDSGVAETPRDSVVTGTATDGDGRTEDGEDEDVEIRDVSPAREASLRHTKGRSSKAGGERGRRGRAVGTSANSRGGTIRGKKKQKR